MPNQSCRLENREELAAQFAGARLAPADYDAFGAHLLTCAECRALVQEAAEVRAAFRTRVRRRRAFVATPLAGVAAAAVIAWVMLTPSAVQRLGQVTEPPTIRPMDVRADADSAAAFAARGIDAYRQRDYSMAARWLARAYAEHEQPGTAFLLGASLLMNDRSDSAVVALSRVITGPPSVYAAEARYYRAMAWLQLEQPDSASADLASVARTAGTRELRARAAELLARVEQLR